LSKWAEKPTKSEKKKHLQAVKKQGIDLSKWAEKPENPKKIQSHVRQTSDTKATTKVQPEQATTENTSEKKERRSLALTGSAELRELSNKLSQFQEVGPNDFDNDFSFCRDYFHVILLFIPL
jgi:hypothetical protein